MEITWIYKKYGKHMFHVIYTKETFQLLHIMEKEEMKTKKPQTEQEPFDLQYMQEKASRLKHFLKDTKSYYFTEWGVRKGHKVHEI